MNLVPKGSEVILGSPVDLDLSAIVVNLERRAFLDTPGQEVLLVLTAPPALRDNRDTEVTQAFPANQDT